jgi:hypothetical protein
MLREPGGCGIGGGATPTTNGLPVGELQQQNEEIFVPKH